MTGMVKEKRKKSLDVYFGGIATAPILERRVKLADRLDNLHTLDEWKQERIAKYLDETRTYVLPIAQFTESTHWLKELERECERISRLITT